MRSIFSIALLFVFLAVHSGVGINLHYCNGNLRSVEIAGMEDTNCCGVPMVKAPNCCSTDTVLLECEEDHMPVVQVNDIKIPVVVYTGWATVEVPMPDHQDEVLRQDRAPPEISGPPTYIRNSQLITYG